MNNEQLCILAKSGDSSVKNDLIINNLRFIKKTANEIWSSETKINEAIGVERDDLVQEGSLGLLGCIGSFQPDSGNKFLTYAAPAIRNAMLDYIRRKSVSFEAKNLDEIIRLDEVAKNENQAQHEFVADSRQQNPELIYIAKESHNELIAALEIIVPRERAYLWYRFGFVDNIEHPLTKTAEHFHLSESRAKSTEELAIDNVWLELPWWF